MANCTGTSEDLRSQLLVKVYKEISQSANAVVVFTVTVTTTSTIVRVIFVFAITDFLFICFGSFFVDRFGYLAREVINFVKVDLAILFELEPI